MLVAEFRSMALNGLFCADVLRPPDLVPLTDFTYKYHPGGQYFADLLPFRKLNAFRYAKLLSITHYKGSSNSKGSSLVIAPLIILDSGAFTVSEVAADWHGCSTAAQASGCQLPALTDF